MSMQFLSLDFVNNRPPTNSGLTLLTFGILLLIVSLLHWVDLQNKAHSINLQLQELQAFEEKKLSSFHNPESRKSAEISEQFVAIDSFTPNLWVNLLNQLELSMTEDVALLSIEPNAKLEKLDITAEAKDYQAILAFIKSLNEIKALQNIHLVDHKVKVDSPGQPIYFSLSATWRK